MKTIISIENPTQQVILALASVISAYEEQSSTSAPVEDPGASAVTGQASEPEKTRRRRSGSTQTEQPAEQKETPTEDEQPSKSDAPTVVELRAKAQEVGTTPEAKKAIKALLDKFDAKSISSIPEEKRADFLTELDLI